METPATLWQSHARRTARRVNFAWWLEAFLPAAAIAGVAVFAVVFYLRSRGTELPAGPAWAGVLGIYALAALAAWLRVRRRFVRESDGMVLLESTLRLDNALTAAGHGVRTWPEAPERVDDGFRLKWQWLAGPAALTFTCLGLAFFLPVPASAKSVSLPPPQSWSQMDALLETLEAAEVPKKEELEKAREQLDELKRQDPGEWYSHSSLEASDSMKAGLERTAAEMGQNLESAANSLATLDKFASELSQSARDNLSKEFQNAVQGLQSSPLGLNQKLMDQLKGLDPSQLKQLSKEQLEKMMKSLKERAAACKECQGNCKSDAERALEELLNGNGEGDREGRGRGGVGRGPGTTPLTYSRRASELGTSNLERLESDDLSRALPGDNLGTADGTHDPDKSATGPVSGGALRSNGTGGEAVWKESLVPSEKKVLQRYFK